MFPRLQPVGLLAYLTDARANQARKARQDGGIAECRLSTLARLADGLGVATKDLYDEDARVFRRLREERHSGYAEAAEEAERPYGSYGATGNARTPEHRNKRKA